MLTGAFIVVLQTEQTRFRDTTECIHDLPTSVGIQGSFTINTYGLNTQTCRDYVHERKNNGPTLDAN